MLHPNLLRFIDPTAPYTYKVTIALSTISANTSGVDKIIVQDRGFVCTSAHVSAWYLNTGKSKRIIPTDSAVDVTRILLKTTGGQRDFMQSSMDIQAFNEAYSGETFAGMFLATKTEVVATIYNDIITASNYALPVYFDVAFSGYQSFVNEYPQNMR